MVTNNKLQILAIALLLGLGIVFCGSGCSTLQIANPNNALPTASSAKQSFGEYQVRLQSHFGKGKTFQGPIDGPITVQTALERSGAVEEYRAMEITLMRVVKENGQPLKLPVIYRGSKKTVRPEQDYALHPNDVIVVTAKSNNPLDKFVNALSPTK